MDTLKISKTQKGADCVVLNNYTYRLDYATSHGDKYWRCTVKGCKSRVKTDGQVTTTLTAVTNHNHDRDYRTTEKTILRAAVKRRAEADVSERPAKIMKSELLQMEEANLVHKDIINVRRSIYRQRRKQLPKLPKTREDVHRILNNDFHPTTSKGEKFVLHNDDGTGIIIFSTDSNLKELCSAHVEELFVDGTFKSCPPQFSQIYSIHCLSNDIYCPLVFCLLPSKTQETYKNMWKAILSLCRERSLSLQCRQFSMDFEKAAMTALKTLIPDAIVKACNFHLGQALHRKIQQLGLGHEFQTKNEVGKWLTYTFGLSSLDPSEVEDSFAMDLMSCQPDDTKLIHYSDYLLQTYILPSSPFPPPLWASVPKGQKRTNNAAESFHSMLNKEFYAPHPNVFLLTDALIKFQATTYIKMRSKAESKKQPKDQKVAQLVSEKKTGQRSRFEFVKAMSFINRPL